MRGTVIRGWDRTWPASPESVAEVRRAVTRSAREAGLGELRLHELRLAITEACANVVMHAPEAPGLAVAVTADEGLQVTVRDHGGGLRPRSDSPGAGLGLSIIWTLADEVEVDTPPDGGTRLRMTFHLAA